jgi:hypothetical protein
MMSWTPAYVMRDRHLTQVLDRLNVPKKRRKAKKQVSKPRRQADKATN